ncbi:MAG: helix-turn-helix domain-containing protein [Saprospiraceae bacterium]|nr:helix-turn-helix domain-containing protein [Saprospiraceae bacterium]
MIIQTETELKAAFALLDQLLTEMGDDTAKQAEAKLLAEAIQEYESQYVSFPLPTSLIGMIELKMYEMKLKRQDLALLLGIETSRVSEYLNGKRKINLEFAKKVHEKLGIDGNFILESV